MTRPITMTRAFVRLAGGVVTAAALSACLGGSNEPGFDPRADRPVTSFPVAASDVDYFPHRFPAPQGEIEPLPPQF